jgi:DNA-binding response OmpR family regulator
MIDTCYTSNMAGSGKKKTGKEKKKRILIAEDERPMAKALFLKLENEGYEAVNVYDGQTALDTAKKEAFDTILLDIMMPIVNGFDVLSSLKSSKKRVPPVLVLSNLSQEEDVEKAKELGAVEFVVKSNTPINDVVTLIKKYV